MKKTISIIVCLSIVIGIFSGCRGGLYMEDFIDVQWTCGDIDMEFTYSSASPEMAIGTLNKDTETIDIVCRYALTKTIWIFEKLEYESITGDEACEPLLAGSYVIEGDVATVTITRDNLFNGEYLNEVIYLEKTPLIDSSNTD